ncbi:hypothetical protein WA026_008153 [Henosepilachna vigintioctopunctata]|uniref:WD repeat domain-containing protein 83 n=1 Tax=Henosepilachna vigintioctopunctata TaxID=420089 RepID=A0AAW1TR30_9CUCU
MSELDLQCLTTIDCKQGAVRAVRFNVDGSYCLTCGSDRKLKLWNPYRNLLLKTYGGHGNEVLDACGSCDSSQIVSCSSDKSVILWDVSTGQPLRRYRGHASSVKCVKFNEESTVIISGSLDNSIMCWDVKSRNTEPIQVLKDAKDCINSLRVSDFEILAGSLDCTIRRYDLRNGSCHMDFLGAPVMSVDFSHDGQCVLAGSTDNTIRLMDKNTGEMLAEYTGHNTDDMHIESGIITSDDHIISGSSTGELYIWDLINAKIVKKLVHTPGKVLNSISIHPKKDVILTSSVNNIKVWGPSDLTIENVIENTDT